MRAVVVGGGLAGLATSARLAKQGHEVALLEAGDRLGGALAPLERDGFRWDSGASTTLLPAVLRDLFRKTGRPLERELELVPVEPARQHRFEEGGQVDLPAGSRATQIAALDGLEPGLGLRWADWTAGFADTWEALRKDWLEQPWTPWSAEHASPATRAAFASRRTVHRAARALKDDRLEDIVRAEWVLAGQDPRNVPAWAAMSCYVEQRFGVWTVPGGLSRIADALVGRLATRGVEVHTGTPVRDLELSGDRARGVRTEHGTVEADVVVVAVDPRRLPALAPLVRRTLPAMPPVLSHVALRGDLPEALQGLPHEVVLHGDPLLRLTTGGGSGPVPGDRAWTIAGQGRVSEDLVTALARHGLDVRDNLVHRVDLSPKDLVQHWAGSPAGVLWQGRRTAGLRLGTRTPVEGVYCAGAHVTPGPGVPYVGLSAALVAAEIGPAR
ncbi:phytoene desaturase [Marmoricola endophyticus]|uniref:Phytoene desaturase n=1 Tax=Marmoricola endophyticus TaxID=2040280 RepID=A0A917BDS3_9ACTN|nr:FAD-dependent oxidoreductase [Marmoricola endophyticus]GGF38056.1 phytoene desaturase [Marmoricola endophyticus]